MSIKLHVANVSQEVDGRTYEVNIQFYVLKLIMQLMGEINKIYLNDLNTILTFFSAKL